MILWADTFNNYFMPHTAQAALEVLEDGGYEVEVPQEHLCCGRPLYDFGMLDEAKAYLRKVMTTLAPQIEAGTPIVCLEPSCASVFRDELVNLFPNEDAARRLAGQVELFPDFLERVRYKPGRFSNGLHDAKAFVHGHCHHKALWSMSPEARLLEQTGLAPEVLDSGCCGLAGSFGYEAEHYGVSMKIGNQMLLPKVRSARPDEFVITDGFSCRQQIMHGTDRHAMHTAEVLQMALHQGQGKRRRGPVERGHTQPESGHPALALVAAAGLLSAGLIYLRARGRRDGEGS